MHLNCSHTFLPTGLRVKCAEFNFLMVDYSDRMLEPSLCQVRIVWRMERYSCSDRTVRAITHSSVWDEASRSLETPEWLSIAWALK